jgi:membrane protein
MEAEPDRGPNLAGWNLAAALGLLAAAFLIERLSPPKDQGFSERETKREASSPGLMADGNERGRVAASPSEIRAEGWKDILLRVYSNVGDHRILALAAGMTYYGRRLKITSGTRHSTRQAILVFK